MILRDGSKPPRTRKTSVSSAGAARAVELQAQLLAEVRRSEERYRTIVEALGCGLTVTDLDDRIQFANGRMEEITGFSPAELIGQRTADLLLLEEDAGRESVRTERRRRGESDRYEEQQVRADGELIWAEIVETPIRDPGGSIVGTAAVWLDITERRAAAESLEARSVTDDLTGLANRRGFFTQAEVDWVVAMAKGEEVMLLFVDMDGFKTINDTFGHAAGDQALQDVAGILRTSFRADDRVEQVASGSTLGRFGGDEFVVLLTVKATAEVERIRERIEGAVDRFNRVGCRPYRLALSIGIVRAQPSADLTFEVALQRADREMYAMKRMRRGEISLDRIRTC